jgi:hypothetical protein
MTQLPKISRPPTTSELRDRVLAQLNGESGRLSQTDQERRARVLGLRTRTSQKVRRA